MCFLNTVTSSRYVKRDFLIYELFKERCTEINVIKRVLRAAIYKTRNTGTGNGMRGMRGMTIPGNAQEDSGECSTRFRGMFKKIPGNAQQDSGECSTRFRGMFNKIPGNAQQDSGECSKRFRGMFKKIPGNVQEDSGECSRGSRGMFKKIPGNVRKDSGECWQRFSRMLKKIGRFIMQLNQNRIKGYILKYNQKHAQKLIKTSHMNEHM